MTFIIVNGGHWKNGRGHRLLVTKHRHQESSTLGRRQFLHVLAEKYYVFRKIALNIIYRSPLISIKYSRECRPKKSNRGNVSNSGISASASSGCLSARRCRAPRIHAEIALRNVEGNVRNKRASFWQYNNRVRATAMITHALKLPLAVS